MKKGHSLSLLIVISLQLTAVSAVHAQADRDCIRKGNRLYHSRQYDKAEAEYRKALSFNGQNPQACYNLGCALMMQQKDSAAIEQYQQAGRMESNKVRKSKAYHNIGVICQNHQMYSDAIEAYKESLRNNPTDNETRYNLALCQRLEKKQPKNKNNQGQNKNDNNKEQEKNNDKQDNPQNNEQKQNNENAPEQKKEEMSKENAEQLLNAATQRERETQQRLKKAMQQPRSKHLQKNW